MKRERKRKEAFEELNEFPERMMSALIPMFVGLALGVGVVAALRAAKLHWSWAPVVGLLLVGPVWELSWQIGLALATALLVATLVGRAWHCRDLERGGTEAREAEERLNPF